MTHTAVESHQLFSWATWEAAWLQYPSEGFPLAFSRSLCGGLCPQEVHPRSYEASATQMSDDTPTPLKQQQKWFFGEVLKMVKIWMD